MPIRDGMTCHKAELVRHLDRDDAGVRAAEPPLFPWAPVFDQLIDGVLVTDIAIDEPGGVTIVYANPAVSEITGYPREELIGRSPRLLQGPKTEPALVERLRSDLQEGRGFQGQATNYRKDGSAFTMEWSISAVADATGVLRWYVAVQRDGTLPARRLMAAQRETYVDPLTGLANRRHLEDALRGGAWLTSRTRSAIVMDIDRFKAINDAHGHLVGDEVLTEVGRRLLAGVRDSDLLARWGGEEFCVLTLGGSSTRALADRLHAAIGATPIQTSAGALAVTISVGYATVSEHLTSAIELLRAADAAMYAAKRDGRDRVHEQRP
jgi:diguanylate cyclase (GGDEF)-like protein/PAS domain S-box-containing protein